jgi:glycosyltransferase involved in cell wall biosynthesis
MTSHDASCYVLFLVSWYPSRVDPLNGIFIRKHAEALSESCKVVVLYVVPEAGAKGYDVEWSEEKGVTTATVYFPRPVHSTFSPMRYLKGNYRGLKEVERRFGRPDLVHVNVALPAGLVALILKLYKGIPYIITEHFSGYTNPDKNFIYNALYVKFVTKIIFMNAKAVTAVSRFLLRALEERGLVRAPGYVVPNIVDIAKDGLPVEKERTRIRILTVSLLNDEDKNVSGLIRAFAGLIQKYGNAELHIVGDGKDREMLEGLARDLGLLGRNVFFHGYVENDHLHEYFEKAHFFALNSNLETFSVVAAEAIAHGLPVVITKCGGPQEFVNDEVGILVEAHNEKSLQAGLEQMMEHFHEYDPLRLMEYGRERFSSKVVGDQIREIYRAVLFQC